MAKVIDCPQRSEACAFEAVGETDEEVVQLAAAHAKNAHDLAPSPQLVASLKKAIRER